MKRSIQRWAPVLAVVLLAGFTAACGGERGEAPRTRSGQDASLVSQTSMKATASPASDTASNAGADPDAGTQTGEQDLSGIESDLAGIDQDLSELDSQLQEANAELGHSDETDVD